jgi:hypothetical protein
MKSIFVIAACAIVSGSTLVLANRVQSEPALPRLNEARSTTANSLQELRQEWDISVKAVMSEHAGQGACEEGVIYHWTGPLPLQIPMVEWTTSIGDQFELPDPVAYALLRCDPRWVEAARTDKNAVQHSGPPSGCTAMLQLPAGQVHLVFLCNQEGCDPVSDCKPSSQIRNEGYCHCVGSGEPTGCHGTFVRTAPHTWDITCGGVCPGDSPLVCTFDYMIIGGLETWWCACG